jgi:hypothetical protein
VSSCGSLHLLVVGCGGAGTQHSPQEPIAVSISPPSASMLVSAAARFSATVTGPSQAGVLFVVLEGNTGGVVATDGTYVAPSIPGTYPSPCLYLGCKTVPDRNGVEGHSRSSMLK